MSLENAILTLAEAINNLAGGAQEIGVPTKPPKKIGVPTKPPKKSKDDNGERSPEEVTANKQAVAKANQEAKKKAAAKKKAEDKKKADEIQDDFLDGLDGEADEDTSLTIEDVRKALMTVAKTIDVDAGSAILSEVGVGRIPELDESQYDQVVSLCNEALEGLE